MNDSQIEVSDYGLFTDAVKTVESFKQEVLSSKDKIYEKKTCLEDTNIFMGPISENCIEVAKATLNTINDNVTSLDTIKQLLITSSTNYTSADTTSIISLGQSQDAKTVAANALNWAVGIANDNSHGYSQNTRWGNPNYDCSSLVISAYENAGIRLKDAGATRTKNMKDAFVQCGFEWIKGDPNKTGLTLQPGDVLLKIGKHTEMYYGDGMNVGAHSNYDNRNGDSSGNEINIGKSSREWDGVLRYTGKTTSIT